MDAGKGVGGEHLLTCRWRCVSGNGSRVLHGTQKAYVQLQAEQATLRSLNGRFRLFLLAENRRVDSLLHAGQLCGRPVSTGEQPALVPDSVPELAREGSPFVLLGPRVCGTGMR